MLTKLKGILKKIGPGFITDAADDDPSGVATYSQTGAIFGYSQLWLSLFGLPFMFVIQQMCGQWLMPPLMVMIILIANNKDIMGKYVNKTSSNIMGGIIVLVMTVAGVLLIFDSITGIK